MSGPIIGRRLGRRQNNSEIGTMESIHDAGGSSKRANTYDTSNTRNYGIRHMHLVTQGVVNSTYRDLASGGQGSFTGHQVFGSGVQNHRNPPMRSEKGSCDRPEYFSNRHCRSVLVGNLGRQCHLWA